MQVRSKWHGLVGIPIAAAAAWGGYGIWKWNARRLRATSSPVSRPSPYLRRMADSNAEVDVSPSPTMVTSPLPPALTTPVLLTSDLNDISAREIDGIVAGEPRPEAATSIMATPSKIPTPLSSPHPMSPVLSPVPLEIEATAPGPSARVKWRPLVISAAIVLGTALLCYGTLARLEPGPRMIGTRDPAAGETATNSDVKPGQGTTEIGPEVAAVSNSTVRPSTTGSSAERMETITPPVPEEGPASGLVRLPPHAALPAVGPRDTIDSAAEPTPRESENRGQKSRHSTAQRRHSRRPHSMAQKTRAFLHKVF